MRLLTQLSPIFPALSKPLYLGIGNFDGIHRGHQALIERVVEQAKANRGISALLTFQEHPFRLL